MMPIFSLAEQNMAREYEYEKWREKTTTKNICLIVDFIRFTNDKWSFLWNDFSLHDNIILFVFACLCAQEICVLKMRMCGGFFFSPIFIQLQLILILAASYLYRKFAKIRHYTEPTHTQRQTKNDSVSTSQKHHHFPTTMSFLTI